MNSSSHTAILLATMNGARFLPEQLDSIANQTHTNWSLWISDDGSSDDTRKQIQEFTRRVPENKVHMIDGPGRGATCNFMSLLGNPGIDADMVAFSDQDDVWLPERLEQSLNKISQDLSTPALYGGRTIVVDQNQKRTGMSPNFTRKPDFANALVQSLAGGNTMLFNRAALHLLRKAGTGIDIVAHDWWVYLLVSGAGGAVFYDETPFVLYRQHSNNLIGSNAGYRAQMTRINGVLRNRFRNWNTKNIAALRSCESLLSPENLTLLSHFEAARKLKGAKAIREIEKIGIYRQTKNGTKSLKLAAALGKI
jgi:glycosyltransferase involved in cell wall biosynthesis